MLNIKSEFNVNMILENKLFFLHKNYFKIYFFVIIAQYLLILSHKSVCIFYILLDIRRICEKFARHCCEVLNVIR